MRKVDPARAQWDTTAELLAGLIELVDISNRMFFAANMKGSVPDPVVINRPWSTEDGDGSNTSEAPRQATVAEMKAFFGGAVQYTP